MGAYPHIAQHRASSNEPVPQRTTAKDLHAQPSTAQSVRCRPPQPSLECSPTEPDLHTLPPARIPSHNRALVPKPPRLHSTAALLRRLRTGRQEPDGRRSTHQGPRARHGGLPARDAGGAIAGADEANVEGGRRRGDRAEEVVGGRGEVEEYRVPERVPEGGGGGEN